MSEAEEKRTKWLHIRLRPDEYRKIQALRSKSLSPKMSDYARRVILNKPVTIRQRNQSMDEFMTEMIKLRAELSAIGNNFNQAVHKLHLLKNVNDLKIWVLMNETTKMALMEKVDEIKNRINQFADQWLR
jgi:hypothetical protein